MHYVARSAQHIGSRQSQQDCYGTSETQDRAFLKHGGFLAIVCDGMGGLEHGEAAGKTAVCSFLEAYTKKTKQESIPEALERSARYANEKVLELAGELKADEGIGTTLVAAAFLDQSLYWISVGDSRIYLVRNGQLELLTRPHVFSNLLDRAVEQGALSREDAEKHPERDSLTSYIGTKKLEEIDANREPLRVARGDTVLLASDGLFKALESNEILDVLKGPPEQSHEALVRLTLDKEKPHQDNVTVVAVRMEETPPRIGPHISKWWVRPTAVFAGLTLIAVVLWWYFGR
jgi:protein phosphatase